MATSKRKSKAPPSSSPTLGADPEFFIRRTDTGAPFPICGLLGGTKGKPIMLGDYGAQEDNVMAEYNIPPATNYVGFSEHIMMGREALLRSLNEKFPGQYELDKACARLFPNDYLRSEQAQMFGCSQDFDAYNTGTPFPRPDRSRMVSRDGEWRFAGGHVHFGYKHYLGEKFPEYVVALFADVYLGLPLVRFDKQGVRRQFYGTPGRYRPTKWGIEYRTLSNLWTFDLGYSEHVGMQATKLGEFIKRPPADIRRCWAEIPWDSVRTSIETEDYRTAEQIVAHLNNQLGMEV
jgi:hypothetical protein